MLAEFSRSINKADSADLITKRNRRIGDQVITSLCYCFGCRSWLLTASGRDDFWTATEALVGSLCIHCVKTEVTTAWRACVLPIDSAHWSAPAGSEEDILSLKVATAASRELPEGSCVSHAEACTGSLAAHLVTIREYDWSFWGLLGKSDAHCAAAAGSVFAHVSATPGSAPFRAGPSGIACK
jgi:hypothetical protein